MSPLTDPINLVPPLPEPVEGYETEDGWYPYPIWWRLRQEKMARVLESMPRRGWSPVVMKWTR